VKSDQFQNNLSFIQSIVNQIEDEIADEVNIKKLADDMGVSAWHFQRLFKSLVGDTLGNYLRGRRLTRAAQLLTDSQLGIIDIAMESGFNSHEAFSRSFKSHFDLTPKAFRQSPPKITLKEKPVLSDTLFHHLDQELDRVPNIVLRPAFSISGFSIDIPSPFLTGESYCDLVETPWRKLIEISHQKGLSTSIPYYGLTASTSGDFTEEQIQYIAGIESKYLSDNTEAERYQFPEQLIAVFDVNTVDEFSVGKTMDYIYGYWLPNSEYNRGKGSDYEIIHNVSGFEMGGLKSQYVVPLQPKEKN